MKREIKFKSYIRTISTGEIRQYIWIPFPIDSGKSDPVLSDNEEIIDYGLQFTGLKDKNGKEIYEGDVVKHDFETDYGPKEHRDIVEYLGGAFYPICEKPENEFEVIGNIYENPELL